MRHRLIGPFDWPHRWGVALTISFLVLFAAVVVGALSFVEQAGRRTIAAKQAETVEVEMSLLLNTYEVGGYNELLRAIDYRLTSPKASKDRIYAIANKRGRIIAGNLRYWPDGLSPGMSWQKLGGRNSVVYVSSVRLENGDVLIAGNTDTAMDHFRKQIFEAGFVAMMIVLMACAVAALIITWYFRSKVSVIANVAAKVTRGDFSARAPGDAEEGPFGQIASAQNIMLDRIEHLVVGLTTITDSLAHDLRTPLSRLKGYLETGIVSDSSEDRDQALESAFHESDHIVSTFSALIDIARANGGLSREAMESLDLRQIVGDVQTLFEPLIEERGGHILVDAPEKVIVRGHKALLMQAISNLVDNAIKHAPENSVVELSLRQTYATAEITVGDHGEGIPAGDREGLLKRFVQAGGATPGGVGLGLAIAKACAVLHNGSIWLEDNHPGLSVRLVISKT